MIGKLAALLGRARPPSPAGLPEVYLDFSSTTQPFSIIALRIRNKSSKSVTIADLDFFDFETEKVIPIVDCVVGGGQRLKYAVKPGDPGVLDLKSGSFRARLEDAGLTGVVKGKIRARLTRDSSELLASPEIVIDFSNEVVNYRHVGQKGPR